MRDVERVLQRGAQGGVQVAPEDRLAGTGTVDHGKGERRPGSVRHPARPTPTRSRPAPPSRAMGTCQVDWVRPWRRPGTRRHRPPPSKRPAVVAALEQAVAGDPSERERVVAVTRTGRGRRPGVPPAPRNTTSGVSISVTASGRRPSSDDRATGYHQRRGKATEYAPGSMPPSCRSGARAPTGGAVAARSFDE